MDKAVSDNIPVKEPKENVILYSLLDCIHCDRMKANLDKLGYQYTVVNNIEVLEMKDIPLVPALEVNGRLLQHHEALDWVEDRMGERKGVADKPLLTKAFLRKYPDHPDHMTPLGLFTYYRTYSRYLPDLGRRETWKETVARAVEYNVGLDRAHRIKNRMPVPEKWLRKEAQELFDAVFNLKMFLSGRTLFSGGAPTTLKYPMANFNCSFTNIEKWSDLPEIFYLLMLGSGMGFKTTKAMCDKLPPIRINTKLIISPYQPVPEDYRLEDTDLRSLENGFAKIYVGDSKEGLRDALHMYLRLLTEPKYEHIHTIKISFNSVRPRGEVLKTFGGTASGPQPLMQMFEGIDNVLKNKIDRSLDPIVPDEKGYGKVRPNHILDMETLVSSNVVSGGVRRSASLCLFEPDDYEIMFAKYAINGFWTEEHFKQHKAVGRALDRLGIPRPGWFDDVGLKHYDKHINGDKPYNYGRKNIHHRRLSNNSIAFTEKPSDELLNLVFQLIKLDGEPGFYNIEAGSKRRFNMEGTNPCGEILLDSKQQCNLTTVNLTAFADKDNPGFENFDMRQAQAVQKLSARAGYRMALVDLELPEWDANNKRDRLTGCSMTGFEDATVGFRPEDRRGLLAAMQEAVDSALTEYSCTIRDKKPLISTCVKPEGSLSLVAGGVSPGLHNAHSPYYIRRIRVSADDSLAKMAMDLEWPVHPEIGTLDNDIANARTVVIDFPVKSGAAVTKDDVSALEQLDRYLMFQRYYSQHNSSNTITVRPHEWDGLEAAIKDAWDDFVGVSFLAHDGGTYQLAPYEAITEEEYLKLKAAFKPFDPAVLAKYERGEEHILDDHDPSCGTGSCPVR